MELLEKSDKEIQDIAQPIWDNLVKSSNIKDYGGFTKDFSSQMLYGANEVELGKQWANNELISTLSEGCKALGCIRRGLYITILYKQTSTKIPGEFLGRLVLGNEGDMVKVFGATIFQSKFRSKKNTEIEKNNLIPENTPHSIAGGIIYFVSQECNLNIPKSTINNISKISIIENYNIL